MKMINTQELKEASETLGPNDIILDVRREDEYKNGHIKGSIQIMHEEVGAQLDSLKKYETVYVVCRSGKRAQVACTILNAMDPPTLICVSNGGMLEWDEKGYPVHRIED